MPGVVRTGPPLAEHLPSKAGERDGQLWEPGSSRLLHLEGMSMSFTFLGDWFSRGATRTATRMTCSGSTAKQPRESPAAPGAQSCPRRDAQIQLPKEVPPSSNSQPRISTARALPNTRVGREMKSFTQHHLLLCCLCPGPRCTHRARSCCRNPRLSEGPHHCGPADLTGNLERGNREG